MAALSAHISVNALNEYADFRSGLDAMTQRTPFSGGSGTLQAHPGLATWTLVLGLGTLALSLALGLDLLAYWLIVVGVLAQVLPPGALLGCLTAPLAWKTGRGASVHADDLPALVSHLGANVAITLLTPVLMATGMLLG